MQIDHLSFSEAVERLAEPGRRAAALRGGRRHRPTGRRASAAGWSRRTTRRPRSTPSSCRRRRPRRDGSSSPSAASTRPRPSTSAWASRRASGTRSSRHLRGRGFSTEELVTGGPGPAGQPRADRPVHGPAAVADPRHHRRRDRVRRAPALRRRPDRGEVPQHPRDAALQEVARCSTASTWPSARSPGACRRSSSRATPTSWPATSPASRPRSPPAARRSATSTSRSCAAS